MSDESAPKRWAIRSTRVCLPDRIQAATLVIEGQKITSVIVGEAPSDVPLTDVGDLVIAPGLIDAGVHINEPGQEDWEGFQSATRAAAAGGVTTLIDMPLCSIPVTTTVEALKAKKEAAKNQCLVDVEFFGGLIPGNADEVVGLIEHGVRGIKTYLCNSGLDEFPAVEKDELRAIMPVLATHRVPLLVHAELTDDSPPTIQNLRSYSEYATSRPSSWEVRAIKRLIRLCREYRTDIHIAPFSASQALPAIKAARKEGLPLTIATSPHYLYFAAEQIGSGQTHFKCAPPIRSEKNQRKLNEALQRGHIDSVASDHQSFPPELRKMDTGDIVRARGGIASLQLTLPIMSTLANRNGWSLEQLTSWLSTTPAKRFGLDQNKGQLTEGKDADLCVWDPTAKWTVRAEELLHRHKVTPYAGEQLTGQVHQTYSRGKLVFDSQSPST